MSTKKTTTEFIPDDVLAAINNVFEHGAPKHGTFGWLSVDPHGDKGLGHQVRKALAHIWKWELDPVDNDSGQSHLAHAAARLIIALNMELKLNGTGRTERAGEDVSQTSTVSDYIQKEVAAWKAKTGRNG